MSMPVSLTDFVFTGGDKTLRALKHIVEREDFFPHPHNNCLLLHGTYGTGKTLLASMLPALIEYARATPSDKAAFDYVYQYMGKFYSITPEQSDKPQLHPFVSFYGCGGESAGEKSKITSKLKATLRNSYACLQTRYRFFIFDEIDELGKSQSDLKSVITSAPADAVFILTTNHANLLDKGLESRSSCVLMAQVTAQQYLPHVRRLYPRLDSVSDAALLNLTSQCNSDWRKIRRALDTTLLEIAS